MLQSIHNPYGCNNRPLPSPINEIHKVTLRGEIQNSGVPLVSNVDHSIGIYGYS